MPLENFKDSNCEIGPISGKRKNRGQFGKDLLDSGKASLGHGSWGGNA